jgi:hypothetical protein
VLSYAVFTDPAPLRISQPGAPSVGTVYITVSNSHETEVKWKNIVVDVPSGKGPGALVDAVDAIDPRIELDYTPEPGDEAAEFHFFSTRAVFEVSTPSRKQITLPPGGSFTLVLENVLVSSEAGLARLKFREEAECVARRQFMGTRTLTVALPKTAPKVPCNFRPDKSTLDLDAGDTAVLRWEGPDNLDYWIQGPDGTKTSVGRRATGPGVALTKYSWPVSPTPKRGATYTLMAGVADSAGQFEGGYFLTTTVHVRVPEFESGTLTPWIEDTGTKSRVAFVPGGVDITSNGKGGTVQAADVVLTGGVRAKRIWGVNENDGWIEFPAGGITVGQGAGTDLGSVTADKVSAKGVNTPWVGEHDGGKGWLEFPDNGVSIRRDGKQELGTVTAHLADFTGVHTTWVQGRDGSAGWIEFPVTGVNVFQGAGNRQWGTVAADKADVTGVNTSWVQGRDSSAGWIEFPATGVNVFQGAGNRQWGTVAADKADLNDLVTARAQVKEHLAVDGDLHIARNLDVDGDLTVNGDLRPRRNLDVAGKVIAGDLTVRDKLTTDHAEWKLIVHGESLFGGRVNANRLLSVRSEDGWVMHVNEEMVSIQGNLRVHGAFRSDS